MDWHQYSSRAVSYLDSSHFSIVLFELVIAPAAARAPLCTLANEPAGDGVADIGAELVALDMLILTTTIDWTSKNDFGLACL